MEWRKFNQADVPQEKVFILEVGKDIFFAKVSGNRIITRNCYADADALSPQGIRSRGGDINWFVENLKTHQNIDAYWAHFHKRGS